MRPGTDIVWTLAELGGAWDIVQRACEHHHARIDEICLPSRAQRVVRARQAAWSALLAEGWSYADIAKAWGMDHSTVIVGVRAHRAREPYRKEPTPPLLPAALATTSADDHGIASVEELAQGGLVTTRFRGPHREALRWYAYHCLRARRRGGVLEVRLTTKEGIAARLLIPAREAS